MIMTLVGNVEDIQFWSWTTTLNYSYTTVEHDGNGHSGLDMPE